MRKTAIILSCFLAFTAAAQPATPDRWITQGGPTPQARQMTRLLADAQQFGLSAADYQGAALLAELARVSQPGTTGTALARFAQELDAQAQHLVHDLHFGRIDPRAAGFALPENRPPLDMPAILSQLSRAHDVQAALSTIEPPFYHYALLKAALRRYLQLSQDASLTRLPAMGVRSIKPGESYAGAPSLRHLLFELGDLPDAGGTSNILDPPLVAALKRFQGRHGLEPDGALGARTFAALTTPLSMRVRQIDLTLERWRWLPMFTTPPIIVNIPQFRLFAFHTLSDRAATIMQMDVIVGKTYANTRTPVFVGDLRTVVFRPYWDVPRSIAVHEMLPQIRRDPKYLARNHLELVDGPGDGSPVVAPSVQAIDALAAGRLRIRQQPGEDNALGLVKFLFPNSYNVYMHSTPAHQLFAQSRRAFSHGCIRVSDPVKLAQFVLRNTTPPWDEVRIRQAMQGADNQRVALKDPVRVMILYATALATEGGPILFFDDLYGLDRRLERLLDNAKQRAPGAAPMGYDPAHSVHPGLEQADIAQAS